ncbi:MAG: ACT domain-containing protein, partial [Chloroflexota bacterium]
PRSSRRRRPSAAGPAGDIRQKIVDVFTVVPVRGEISGQLWANYAADLADLFRRLDAGQQHEAQGELAKRVAVALREMTGEASTLYPVEIDIDNDASDRHTVLRIDAPDTVGFLYEFTNALALNGINIRRMTVDTVGSRVHDTLYVIDNRGQKITAVEKQRELRVATVLIKEFTHLLPRSPNPESALLHFRQFLGQLFTRADWPDELTSLERPEVLQTLARLLGVSDFLWTDFLRMQHANLFPVVRDVAGLARAKSKEQLQVELAARLQAAMDNEARRTAINDFKDREMFRIDMRQIEGHITAFGQFSAELTDLAEVVIEAAYRLCTAELEAEFGRPQRKDGRLCPMSVCALGKCGGRELGFASDIELMFIFDGSGQTTGPRLITNAEFFEKVVQAVNQAIQSKREGIFEIDLRLRPYGKAGSMAVSLDSFRRYFRPDGDAWPYERQALIKLRPIAGDAGLGERIVRLRDELIYSGEPFDVAAMRAMRERQMRHLVTPGTVNVKFSPGGLVDVEYLVQGLQITHGHRQPELRRPNTREAMTALARAGIISPTDFRHLFRAQRFLRRLINALRMVRGNAKDMTVPPLDSEEFHFLARRLNYGSDSNRLQEDLTRYTTWVQELGQRLLG